MAFLRKRTYQNGELETYQIIDKEVTPVYRRSLGAVKPEKAEKLLQEYLKNRERILVERNDPRASLLELVDQYLDYCAVNRAESTFELHRLCCRHLVGYFGDCPLGDITSQSLEGYKTHRREKRVNMGRGRTKVKPRTVNIELGVLRKMLKVGKIRGLVKKVPHFEMLREEKPDIRFLTVEEANRLVDACQDWLRPIVVMGLETGMRRGEILGLTWNDIDLENGRITIRTSTTKTKEPRVIPMSPRIWEELSRLERKGVLLFPKRNGERRKTFREGLRTACRNAGIVPPISPNKLRHTFSSVVLNDPERGSTEKMKVVQEILGHKKISTTMNIYAHLTTTHKKNVIDNLPFGKSVK